MYGPAHVDVGLSIQSPRIQKGLLVLGSIECLVLSISKLYVSLWKTPGVSERMSSVNLEASILGEYRTLAGYSGRPSE